MAAGRPVATGMAAPRRTIRRRNVRALSMFGLLVSLALAPCVLPPAWAQGSVTDYSKAVKARFDDTKKRTDELIKRQEHIIKLFKSADPKAVESSFE
jgi:hypothetical protein